MDLLSSALLSFKAQPLFVVDCRFAGEWGIVCDDLALPYAVILLEGECWTTEGDAPPVRMRAGDAQLMLRRATMRWRSAPGVPCQRTSERAAELGYALGPARQMLRTPWRVRFGEEGRGSGSPGRFIIFVFESTAFATGPLARLLPAVVSLWGTPNSTVPAAHAALLRLLDGPTDLPGQAAVVHTVATHVLAGLLREWVVARAEAVPGGVDGWLDDRFARAVSAMQAQPASAWRLEALASLAGMSRSAFARDFPVVFGCPPMRYLADLRVQRALTLLDNTAWPVERIAAEVGLGSAQRLRVAVLRRTGLTPGAWRSRNEPR